MISPTHTKWLTITQIKDTGKTTVWSVVNTQKNELIGHISWDPGWRRYAFNDGVIKLEEDCLRDLADVIHKLMDERKMTEVDKFLDSIRKDATKKVLKQYEGVETT